MSGPPPKPTALRVVQGNPGRRPFNRREPTPPPGRPACPDWLPRTAKHAWRELCDLLDEMGLLSQADRRALELLVAAYAEWRQATADVKSEGAWYQTTSTTGAVVYRAHPATAIASDAYRRIRSMLIEFGLTPAARSKVNAADEPPADPFEELLERGRKAKRRRGPGPKAS
jgi:P27 family predicted phage terminase small subunit